MKREDWQLAFGMTMVLLLMTLADLIMSDTLKLP